MRDARARPTCVQIKVSDDFMEPSVDDRSCVYCVMFVAFGTRDVAWNINNNKNLVVGLTFPSQ